MSGSGQQLTRSAIRLALGCLEAREPILSAATAELYEVEAAALEKAGLLRAVGHETASADAFDRPVELSWSPEHEKYGYFAESGWVTVAQTRLLAFDVVAFIEQLTANLDLGPRHQPRPLVDGHLWDVGAVRLKSRPKRMPVVFARRLCDRDTWQGVEAALIHRPSDQPRILITSTPPELLPKASERCKLVSIGPLLEGGSGLAIDPLHIASCFDPRLAARDDSILVVFADGKEVRFKGETYRFAKGLLQRNVIMFLYGRYRAGDRWVSSAEVAEECGLGAKTRIRDLFKKHPAWGHLLTEKSGLCGFCFD